ncbi:hypothetical protein M1N20_02665 [Dehalococcoidia bacterium]|nr:hypothetical protein [Dehalococcoidia bacterium]
MKIYRKPISRGGATAVGLLLALSLVLSLAIPAFAAGNSSTPATGPGKPGKPHIFHGTVTIGGATACDGILVSAYVGLDERASDTVAAGKYAFHVSARPGDTIRFYVGGTYAASHPWWAGETTELNLAIDALLPTVQVDLSMVLQGGDRPPEGWKIPVTINFFEPGAAVLVDTPLRSFTVTTAKVDGRAVAQVSIAPGTYDVTVASETTLINVRRNVEIAAPDLVVDMGTLLEGNANGDQVINMIDFSILAGSFGRHEGDVDFTKGADFDRNGAINMIDFSLLAGNFGETSPVEVP